MQQRHRRKKQLLRGASKRSEPLDASALLEHRGCAPSEAHRGIAQHLVGTLRSKAVGFATIDGSNFLACQQKSDFYIQVSPTMPYFNWDDLDATFDNCMENSVEEPVHYSGKYRSEDEQENDQDHVDGSRSIPESELPYAISLHIDARLEKVTGAMTSQLASCGF